MVSTLIILQAQRQSLSNMLLMIFLMFVVFYFFMIRPQLRRQKSDKKFQQALKRGYRVVTNGGIHGKVVELTDDACVVETSAGKIKFERTAVSRDITQLRYAQNAESIKKQKDIENQSV
ncbi:MAG: preprotein translocase subunit YajC [Flavobacteriales bacterium Tduv]